MDAQEALVWGHTIEGLLRVGNGRETSVWIQRLKAAGLDVNKPVQRVYTREQWKSFISVSAEELFAGTPEQRYEQLGGAFIDAYAQTFMGKGVAAVLKVIGPMRTLERMTKNMRSANNYSDTKFTATGKTSGELWVNETHGAPDYVRGAMAAILRHSGAKNPRATIREQDGRTATYTMEWDP